MNNAFKVAGVLAGAALLTSTGVAVADVPQTQVEPADLTAQQAQEGVVEVDAVEGTFSFSQDVLTPNSAVKDAFQRAGASLCATIADCAAQVEGWNISVTTQNGEVSATIEEINAAGGNVTAIMGCACTSNGIAGSAIANVAAQGIPLPVLMSIAGL